MKGRDLPPYIYRHKRDGSLWFGRRSGGKMISVKLETQFPVGDPVPFALHQERERLLNEPTPVKPGQDIAAVLRHYIASAAYRGLAPRTRADYDKHLTYFAAKLGTLRPRDVERHDVLRWREAWAKKETPHAANYRVRVMSIVMEHAKDMGLLKKSDDNPAQGIKALKYDKRDRHPWPEAKIKEFRAAFAYGTKERTIFELCLGTGQRIGDVLRMRWSDIEAGAMSVRQGKTGTQLLVPLTAQLQAALTAWPQEHLTILHDGSKPLSYWQAAHTMRDARKVIGAETFDNHGLRYSAAVELLLAGCDDGLIASVTGQSEAMVRHYTRHVRQKVRAIEAQGKRK